MESAPLIKLPEFPAVGGSCLLAAGLYFGVPEELLDNLHLDLRAFWAEPWRLLTSALLHGGLLHLGFNLYWLWLLGSAVERRLGHLKTLGLLALFGAGASMAEYAFSGSAVGLSGVVYGLAAMVAILARRDPRWRGVIESREVWMLGVWFGLCIGLTIADVLPVANFAHGGGAALGALVALAMSAKDGRRKVACVAGVVAMTGLFATGASVGRRYINLSTRAGLDAMALAERAERRQDLSQAQVWAERGVGYWRTPADHWAYLARIYYVNGETRSACAALREAIEREPGTALYRTALAEIEAEHAAKTQTRDCE